MLESSSFSEITPKQLGYHMPAEWHPHAATQLHWPANRETWPGKRLERVESIYLDIIEILHRYEPIHLFVPDGETRKRVHERLSSGMIDMKRITLHTQPVNDVWARDCGPIFVKKEGPADGQFAVTDWEYNAWGGKYSPYEDDNMLPSYVAEFFGLKRFETGMVLEGGSIDTNGNGVLLTTESVLLNPNRNPRMSREEIEVRICEYLGIEKIIWLKGGLAGDDTDGHIDDLARFLSEDTIMTVVTEDPGDVNYDILQENLAILEDAADQHGRLFRIETVTLPGTEIVGSTVDGSSYVPASYANFYIANGVVLMPLYDERRDQEAAELLRRYFPDRDLRGVPCADLVWGQGSIHCITQQLYGLPG